MNRRIRTWDRPKLGDDLLERVLLRKHIKEISPLAYHMLNSFGVQEVAESDPVHMAVGFHFEDKIIYVPKAKAAVPPRVRQKVISLPVMGIPRLPRSVSVY